jgi:hypothetical protein
MRGVLVLASAKTAFARLDYNCMRQRMALSGTRGFQVAAFSPRIDTSLSRHGPAVAGDSRWHRGSPAQARPAKCLTRERNETIGGQTRIELLEGYTGAGNDGLGRTADCSLAWWRLLLGRWW